MLIWWIVDEIRLNADPYREGAFWTFTSTSLINILTQVKFEIDFFGLNLYIAFFVSVDCSDMYSDWGELVDQTDSHVEKVCNK